jgi:rhodanese-related sulfurtransferase
MRRSLFESQGMLGQLFEFIGNHILLVGLFAVLLALFIRNEMQRGGRTLSSQELVNLVNRESAVVVDVRDTKEFESGHIVGAVNVPHTVLEARLNELNKYKDRPVVLVCRMGQNSGAAGATLRKHGFENVARLTGGMAEWRNQSLPVVKG